MKKPAKPELKKKKKNNTRRKKGKKRTARKWTTKETDTGCLSDTVKVAT